VTVGCNMVVYRSRLDTDEDWWVGRRIDRLRNVEGHWKIARREIYLDQTVLKSKNLTTFF
jgi:3-phenylpropionate/cinnamic acid dioxygenase small subunit